MSPASSTLRRGLFIVFEGCDRCGKTTQSRLLAEFFEKNKVPVKHLVFPARDSDIGKVIDAYLRSKQELSDQAIHLLFSANRWEAVSNMRKLLNEGVTLIVDRYSYSGVAYSVAKGLNYDWCFSPEKGLIRPDIVFYLKAPLQSLAARGNYGEERYEKQEFQQKVDDVFNRIYKSEQHYWQEINASATKDEIHDEICKIALRKLKDLKENAPFEILT